MICNQRGENRLLGHDHLISSRPEYHNFFIKNPTTQFWKSEKKKERKRKKGTQPYRKPKKKNHFSIKCNKQNGRENLSMCWNVSGQRWISWINLPKINRVSPPMRTFSVLRRNVLRTAISRRWWRVMGLWWWTRMVFVIFCGLFTLISLLLFFVTLLLVLGVLKLSHSSFLILFLNGKTRNSEKNMIIINKCYLAV